jgi:hypothetical protein
MWPIRGQNRAKLDPSLIRALHCWVGELNGGTIQDNFIIGYGEHPELPLFDMNPAARGAIMRKLLHICFGVLKHHQPFNPALAYIPQNP